jgi:hypothetical protein
MIYKGFNRTIRDIFIIVLCVLITITIFPQTNIVLAGDEENPEIEDNIGDCPIKTIDIVSAWFFEDSKDPNFLYVAIKVRDLQYKWIITNYVMYWYFNSTLYFSLLSTWGQGSNSICSIVENGVLLQQIAGSCDLENDVIAMKIPKNLIGDPSPGDLLIRPFAFSRFTMFGGILGPLSPLADYAPNNRQGKNYVIQY